MAPIAVRTLPVLNGLRRLAASAIIIGVTAISVWCDASDLAFLEALIHRGELTKALEGLLSAEETAPGNAKAAYWIGRIYLHDQWLERARDWLDRAVQRQRTEAAAYWALGEAYAVSAMQAPLLGKLNFARSARRHFEEAVALDPEHIEARFSLARFYAFAPSVAGGGRKQAEAQAAEIKKRNAWQGTRIEATLYEARQEFARAIETYRNWLTASPRDQAALNELAQCYANAGQYQNAFATCDELLKIAPNHMPGHYQIGRTSALSGMNLDRGAAALNRYLGYQPRLDEPPIVWAHYRLGMIHARQGNFQSAESQFRLALQRSPNHRLLLDELKKLERR